MPGPLDIAAALRRAGREVGTPRDVDAILQSIVEVALDSMAEIDHVGVTVAHRDGRVVTRAATDEVVTRLDLLQRELGEGPALHVVDGDPVVRVDHARHEQRWPAFVPRAVTLGLRSHLGVRVHVDEVTTGVLTLYSFSSDTVSAATEQLAELFAVHAGLVLGHARQIDHLSAALESRRVIGIALGMLMQRLDCDEATAFAYLTRVSASTETKLRDVAGRIVEDHRLRER